MLTQVTSNNTLCRFYLLVFLTLFSLTYAYGQREQTFVVYSQQTMLPVPFCSIALNLGNGINKFTSSDSLGHVYLRSILAQTGTVEESNVNIFASSLGYENIVVPLSEVINSGKLLLKPVLIKLEDVSITAKARSFKYAKVGDIKLPILKNDRVRFCDRSDWAHIGVYVSGFPKASKKAFINSVDVFIMDDGSFKSTFAIRIMKNKFGRKYKSGRTFASDELIDVLAENVISRVDKPGWFTIDLSKIPVQVDNAGVYIVFTPIDDRDKKYVINDQQGKPLNCTGVVFGMQKDHSAHIRNFLFGPLSSGMLPFPNSNYGVVVNYKY